MHYFCDDYTAGSAPFVGRNGKRFRIPLRSLDEAIDAEFDAFEPPSYVVPSNGLIVIARSCTGIRITAWFSPTSHMRLGMARSATEF